VTKEAKDRVSWESRHRTHIKCFFVR
jgi:hypothetical protein